MKMRQKIISFFEKNIEKIKSVKELKGGHVNKVFKINNFIVRVNIRDPHIQKLKNESFFLKFLSKVHLGFKVPKNIVFFRINGKEIIVNSFLTATPLNKLDISNSIIKDLARKIKKLHGVKGSYFGDVNHHYSSWGGYVKFALKRNIKDCIRYKALSKKQIQSIKRVISRNSSFLSDIKTPYFVHADLGFSNFLIKNQKLYGLIDFEWSFFGDPLYDFAILELAVNSYLKMKNLFEKEYRLNAKNNETRKDIYKLLYLSELIPVDKRFWNSRFRKVMLKQLDSILEKLSR